MFDLFKCRNSEKIVLKYYKTTDSFECFTYDQLYHDSVKLQNELRNVLKTIHSDVDVEEGSQSISCLNIALLFTIHSPAILPAIVGIDGTHCGSCFIDESLDFLDIVKRLEQFQTNIILCDSPNLSKFNTKNGCVKVVSKVVLFERECSLLQLENMLVIPKRVPHKADNENSSRILFYATTSGSCGDVKPIGVTAKCFLPNIKRFGDFYGLSATDTIFISSPPTFDPFMLDVSLALCHGASLLMVHNDIRCNAAPLLNILFPIDASTQDLNVTVLQTTPSLFMRWTDHEIKNRVLSSKSHLRILALGGERFPSAHTLSKWRSWREHCSTRLFNLYGLTEMSCWSSAYEVTNDDVIRNKTIPIGEPLDEYTQFQVASDGELLIKSKIRKCFQPCLTDAQVFDDDYEWTLHTGDLVEIDNESRIFYKARTNSVIKYFGQKLNLNEIEMIAKQNEAVSDACCTHIEQINQIVLFAKVNEKNCDNVVRQIGNALKTSKINAHIEVFPTPDFPLSNHGKVSKTKLLQDYIATRKQNISSTDLHLVLLMLLNKVLGTSIEFIETSEVAGNCEKRQKSECDASFAVLGGTSLKAIQILNEFEETTSKSYPDLLTMLFDEQKSIREILAFICEQSEAIQDKHTKEVEKKHLNQNHEITHKWQVDFKKCIDATPTVCLLSDNQAIVSVGSHSKLLFNILISNGRVLSKVELPDRIESQVTQLNDCGIVGCYDGYLYCFEFKSGNIKWKFFSDGMIKCRALIMNSSIIFGNYNAQHNCWCVTANNGLLIWSQRIGTKSVFANPMKIDDEDFVICTFDGTVARVNSKLGSVKWTISTNLPIFSTPTIIHNEKTSKINIIFANVSGAVHCLNSVGGECVWKYEIDGNIFSSFQCLPSLSNERCVDIVLGAQNKYLYCLSVDLERQTCDKRWKFETSAPIRSTPQLFVHESQQYLICCSSDGQIVVNDAISGRLIQQRKVNGDIFSTPVIWANNLLVGSRNNLLYCLDYVENFLSRQ